LEVLGVRPGGRVAPPDASAVPRRLLRGNSIAALTRATPRCDIQIMCHRDLEAAVEHASLASAAVEGSSCHLCVVLLQEGLPERARTRAFVRLRDAVRAGGLIVGKGDAKDAFDLTRTLIREFTEGNPLWQQHYRTQAGPAMLLCDERMAAHRLTSWTPERAYDARPGATAHPRAAAKPGGEAPAGAASGGKRFPFMPSGAELKRGAKDGAETGPASGGSRPARRGPRRRQGGAAPLEPNRERAGDGDFGKMKGAPTASAPGSSWIPSSPRIAADPATGQGDEKPGKPASRWRGKTPTFSAAKLKGRGPAAQASPAIPKPTARAAEPASPEPAPPLTGIRYASIVVSENGSEPTLTASSAGGIATVRMKDDVVEAFATAFMTAMSEVASDPARHAGVHAPGTAAVLRLLAQKGASLRDSLEQSGGLVPGVTHVQLTSANPVTTFPIEYVYALDAPDDDAKMCDRAEEGLRAEGSQLFHGWCPGCTPPQWSVEDQRRTLCPLAFWGVLCAIERRGSASNPEDANGDRGTATDPSRSSENVLHPLRCAVVGTTERVEPADAGALTEALGASVTTLVEAEDWGDWEYAVKRTPTPTMLAMLAHQKRDFRKDAPQLEIGAASSGRTPDSPTSASPASRRRSSRWALSSSPPSRPSADTTRRPSRPNSSARSRAPGSPCRWRRSSRMCAEGCWRTARPPCCPWSRWPTPTGTWTQPCRVGRRWRGIGAGKAKYRARIDRGWLSVCSVSDAWRVWASATRSMTCPSVG
jgi:hypothetical protein